MVPTELESFVKNLVLFAPNKGEARKTVSQGLIRVEYTTSGSGNILLDALATDDVVGINEKVVVPVSDLTRVLPRRVMEQILHEDYVGYYYPDSLKRLLAPSDAEVSLMEDAKFNPEFDRKFWEEHVRDSIGGKAYPNHISAVSFAPERLRKFSLLEPRGLALEWQFVEWADQTVIRWEYGTNGETVGVYAPLEVWGFTSAS